ncbi:hypothetical protein CH263_04865 [Rhodococcus sp. 06-1059B-a]|nr:hypothetical protein CH263_04865 [Rhodococcus sp. 06-1059B-a]OZF03877.1 hypothetical protein CH300_15065 [Rhodococcus sp. 15-1154-1]
MDGMQIDDAVAAALSYLDSVDPASAADAALGWEGLRAVSPPGGPTQISVQTFLWSYLGESVGDPDRAWDIAEALAELLDRLGHARYADIARSERTRELLTTTDEGSRQERVERAVNASGVAPEDSDLITWQDVPEGAERAMVDLIGETLEVASVAGEFQSSGIDGKPLRDSAVAAKRRRITDSVLRSERAGGVLLEQLLDHRIALWTRYSPPRVELYRDLNTALHDAIAPAYGCVRRLEGMLAIVGDGITLTDKGYLPAPVVEQALGTLWTPREWPFPVGDERGTEPVLRVRRLLLRLGLVRKRHGRLLPTARAKEMSADRLWSTLVERLVGAEYHPESIAAEVVLADVARGSCSDDPSPLVTELLAAEGWSHVGGPDAADKDLPLGDDVLQDLAALGLLVYGDDPAPTPDGMRLAAAVLRRRLLHTRIPSV